VENSQLDFLDNRPVEGESLADVLARGRLPADKALQYALDIGTQLNKAHVSGRIHGNLSPSAIVITPDGAARIIQPGLSADVKSASYYSPEKVRGETPDERSDIFSFGAILFELASGKRAFSGSGGELYHQILEQPPASFNARDRYHIGMEAVIAGCLAKDPAARRQRIQNAVIELKLASGIIPEVAALPKHESRREVRTATPAAREPDVAAAVPERPEGRPWPLRPVRTRTTAPGSLKLGWVLLGLIAVAAAAMAGFAYSVLRSQPTPVGVSFRVGPPENTSYPGPPSVSPDGKLIVFSAAGPDSRRLLWMRPLDSLRAVPIPGTDGGSEPFWSPDSKFIGFFANQSLNKVPVDGGSVARICSAEAIGGGAAWSLDGTILFAPGLNGGLSKVPASGGSPEPAVKLNAAKSERAFLWPQFLPDQKHFVFFVLTDFPESTGVYKGSLTPANYGILFASETNAVFSSVAGSSKRGYLLFVSGRSAMAQSFNASSLAVEGDPISIGDEVGSLRSMLLAPISVSSNGVLVYQAVGPTTRQLAWLDRGGRQIASVTETGDWGPPRIAPDGTRAAAAKLGRDGRADLWTVDSAGAATQLTTTAGHKGSPVWSPDGSRLAFFVSSKVETGFDLYTTRVAGGTPELLLSSPTPKYPSDWSRDGRFLFFTSLSPSTKGDVWAVSPANKRAGPIVETVYAEAYGALSPDGKWLAYQSDESGKIETYVQPFDGISSDTKRRWQVSVGGGGMPRWRADGKELFYMTYSGQVMAAAARPSGATFEFDPARLLFQTRPLPKTWNLFDVSGDGQRFIVNEPLEGSNSAGITVLTNWIGKLNSEQGKRGKS